MSELRYDRKVAVITGAGRGLGAEYARLLASRGAAVLVNDAAVHVNSADERPDPAADLAAEITALGGIAVSDSHDVVTEGATIVDHAIDAFGAVNIVINNAGFAAGGEFAAMPEAVFDRACDVHIKGTRAVLRAAWKHLAESGAGRVVNTASNAMFGAPGISPYATGKGAVFALSRAIALEGRAHGINVNVVMPTAYTRLTAMLSGPRRDILAANYPPASVAPFVGWLAHESCPVTGECFSVGGGRAGRVFLAETAGVSLPGGGTPEEWAAHADQLFDLADFGTPSTMVEEVSFGAGVLGIGPTGYA
jgi:NAD(P)-dependent dehydrogenase (short-subunit alcohol dehydrogenase family)